MLETPKAFTPQVEKCEGYVDDQQERNSLTHPWTKEIVVYSDEHAKAYLLGVYLGDGYVDEKGYCFSVVSLDKDLLDKVFKCIYKIYPDLRRSKRIKWSEKPRNGSGKGKLLRFYCRSNRLCRFLTKKTDTKKKLPKFKDATVFHEFVAGLMDTDGWITEYTRKDGYKVWQMGFGSTFPWLKDFRSHLQSCGVEVSSIQKQKNYKREAWKDCYRFYINLKTFVGAGFYFSIKRKQQRLGNWFGQVDMLRALARVNDLSSET